MSNSSERLGQKQHPSLLSFGIFLAIIGPVVSALLLAWLCRLASWEHRSAVFWIAMVPVLYLAWLFLLLGFYVAETSLLALFYTKPRRYHEQEPGSTRTAFLISLTLYGRAFFIGSLPFVPLFICLPGFRWLVLRAYSTRTFLGEGCLLAGYIGDPDLTIIGPGVVVGAYTRLIAHSITRTPDGFAVYQTAPIELGPDCTIGGNTLVEMGVKIGAGSIIEQASHLVPFTIVPPGEVWGGAPAVFRRKREAGARQVESPPSAVIPAVTSGAETQEILALIANALSLPAGTVTSDTSSRNCLAWDSLGKMFIAAALHDRFGLNLSAETIFALDSVADVERELVGSRGNAPAREEAFSALSNPELLPLLDPVNAVAALARRPGNGSPDSATRSKIRIVVASTFVAQPLASTLQLYSRAFGIDAAVEFFDFNQVPQALLAPESSFYQNREGLNVVLVRPEDLAGSGAEGTKSLVDQYLGAIKVFLDVSGAPLLVSDLPPALSSGNARPGFEADPLRLAWREQLQGIERVEVLNFSEIVEEIGKAAARDTGMELAASAPFSAAVYQRLGIGIARAVRKLRVPPKKVLALDGDGTLWGGVIGEDGLTGISVGDDPAGRSYKRLQTEILSLKQRGVLLALVSKNVTEDVWNVIDNHPGMVLRRADFAGARINWNRKSENLRELASELNLGLDSFVLLDDNPVERMEVEANCPGVTVVPLPADPAQHAETLARLWLFDGAGSTREDAKRSEYMQQDTERKHLRQSTRNLEDYLGSLQLEVEFGPAQPEDFPRVAQLSQRTSQFNLSLKRRSAQEIRALRPDFEIWIVSAKDRLGDYGVVGGCIWLKERDVFIIDSLFASCRALGCGVEDAFLHGLVQQARAAGAKKLRASFIEGPRNQPIKSFLIKSGFRMLESGAYELDLANAPVLPGHVKFKPLRGGGLP